ncbi:MAG TPA: efflux RND transporter periplasmic adaptor subunit [Pseudolabrys sp.]|nr:efflux RND transporter periplasmic adaptor subunit [Pseudolabrys sp.]
MAKRTWIIALVALAGVGGYLLVRGNSGVDGAVAQAPAQRAVAIETGQAVRKTVPVRIEVLGTVTPIASVAIKARLETEIVGVHFADGARVQKGDLLFTLDSRAIEAQIAQAEGALAREKAQLAGAERDVARYTELVAKNATPVTNLDNAKTQADVHRAAILSATAQINNLKVQLSYCSIRAPITGRIGAASVKVGNFVRPADIAPLAIINQIAPVYVSFTVPQNTLPTIRRALAAETATVEAAAPGDNRRATGQVAMIENTVDPTTGMVTIRATMDNTDEVLWPGTLVNVSLNIREEEAVTVPTAAVQTSQSGHYVFVIENGSAHVRTVEIEQTMGSETALRSGLSGGETVVTDGHLQLTEGAKVVVRTPKAGA